MKMMVTDHDFFQVEALGLVPEHLLNRLRGQEASVDDVENPLQIMRQQIEDAKKGSNGRLPDNYRQFYQEGAFESSSSMLAWKNSDNAMGSTVTVRNLLSPVKAAPSPSFAHISTTSPPPRPVLPLRPPSPSSLGALRIRPSVISDLHAARDSIDARASSPERARTSWADATGSKEKKIAGKQKFYISSGLAEVLGPTPLECEGPGCHAVSTLLPPPQHAKAVHSDIMRLGTGASDKQPLGAKGAMLGLKAAQAEATFAVHASNLAASTTIQDEGQAGSMSSFQFTNTLDHSRSSSQVALDLDAAYEKRLTDFMADVKFKTTDQVHNPFSDLNAITIISITVCCLIHVQALQRNSRLQLLQHEPGPSKKLGNSSLADQVLYLVRLPIQYLKHRISPRLLRPLPLFRGS